MVTVAGTPFPAIAGASPGIRASTPSFCAVALMQNSNAALQQAVLVATSVILIPRSCLFQSCFQGTQCRSPGYDVPVHRQPQAFAALVLLARRIPGNRSQMSVTGPGIVREVAPCLQQ